MNTLSAVERKNVYSRYIRNEKVNINEVRECYLMDIKQRKDGTLGDYYENVYLGALALYKNGDLENIELLIQAKFINFDTSIGMDIQFLLGAGVEKTISYLKDSSIQNSEEAIDKIQSFSLSEDAESLEEWYDFKLNYYGLS